MEMIEVDPKLFVTCRLCLEDTGVYRILPVVQDQIKFCFDINVDLFDGLPQLLCKKCEVILKEYYHTKKTIIEKQQSLINRFQGKESKPKYEVQDKEIKEENCNDQKAQKRKGSYMDNPPSPIATETKSRKFSPVSWKKEYKKEYVCRLCHKFTKNKKKITKHIRSHQRLIASHECFFNKKCFVPLNKLGEACDFMNLPNTVVIEKNKVIQDIGQTTYHVLYSLKNNHFNIKNKPHKNKEKDSDILTDSSDKLMLLKTCKRQRILSQSSSETVTLEKGSKSSYNQKEIKFSTNIECINLEDSSSDSLPKEKCSKPLELNMTDYTCIHNIILMCQKKTANKKPSGTVLNHKLLNIGRKVVNKGGFSCTGLIRYLEYNHLEINWIKFTQSDTNKNNNITYVRINTKLKDNNVDNSDLSWKSLKKYKSELGNSESDHENISMTKNKATIVIDVMEADNKLNGTDNKNLEFLKLLNKTPVSNPKKLVKKVNNNENKTDTQRDSEPESMITSYNSSVANTELSVSELCMPIITNTTSLAQCENVETTKVDSTHVTDNLNNTEKSFPRIKVKPVSELMSDRVLNNLSTNVTIQPNSILFKESDLTMPDKNNLHDKLNSSDDTRCIIMNSPHLPNFKTNSPYQYIKDVLEINKIILVDSHEMTPEFALIFRFKIQFTQKTVAQPVCLYLSMFNYLNCFCIKVEDYEKQHIDIKILAPFWQWEIFKSYNGDVVNKLMTISTKLGPMVLEYVKSFMSIIRTIECYNS